MEQLYNQFRHTYPADALVLRALKPYVNGERAGHRAVASEKT